MQVLTSASKIVFIVTSVAVTALTFVGKIDPKDFMLLASMVYSYYFTRDKTDIPPSGAAA
jgi:hypothetical protein